MISRDIFLEGMSRVAATVNVITTDGVGGRAGVTATAMTSISADGPYPQLLVCVHHKSKARPAIIENGVFCVNVLRQEQAYISDTFAGRVSMPDGDHFACATWTSLITGAPGIDGALAAFDCELVQANVHGTHHVMIGNVVGISLGDAGAPLIYANRAYGGAMGPDAARGTAPVSAAA